MARMLSICAATTSTTQRASKESAGWLHCPQEGPSFTPNDLHQPGNMVLVLTIVDLGNPTLSILGDHWKVGPNFLSICLACNILYRAPSPTNSPVLE